MRRSKKLFLISLGCAGVAIVLFLAAILIFHLLANRGMVREFIVEKADQATGGNLSYYRLDLSLLPIPHLTVRNFRLTKKESFEVQARMLSVYPRMRSMLMGRLSIYRLILDAPDIQLRMPPLHTTEGSAPETDHGSPPLSATIKKTIGAGWGALAAIDPETLVQVENGALMLDFPDAPDVQISAIRAVARNRDGKLLFKLKCSSRLTGETRITATAGIADQRVDGSIALADFDPRPLLAYFSLPGGITTDPARSALDLDFSVLGNGRTRSTFRFQAPSLAVRRADRKLALTGVDLSGTLASEDSELTVTIDTLASRQPALSLSATAVIGRDEGNGRTRLRCSASAETLDIAVAGNVTRAIAGDLQAVRTAFDVAREGNLTQAKYSIGLERDEAGWHLNNMRATGHLSRGWVTIPGVNADLKDLDGEVVYEDARVEFNQVAGIFKGATFGELSAAIDWERQATLSIASPSVRVDAAPFFTWLTGFAELGGIKDYVRSIDGQADVSKLEISGPLTEPGKWRFTVTGSPENIRLDSPRAPFSIRLSGGEISYRPGSERSSGVTVEFLDGRFVSSHQSMGIIDPEAVTWRIDGSMGPQTLAWLGTILPIPAHLQMKPPVELTGVNIAWGRASGISFAGGMKTAGGVDLYADITHTPELWQIRKIQFSDGHSRATISASKRVSLVDLSFSGDIEKQTIDRLLENNQTLSGRLEGDCQVRFDTKAPMNASFTGRLSGNGLTIRQWAETPIEVGTFSINGHGRRLELGPSEISLFNSRLVVAGKLAPRDNALRFDFNVDAGRLDEALIHSLQTALKGSRTDAQEKAPAAFVPNGIVHLNVDEFSYGGFSWAPVNADIRVEDGNTGVKIHRAELCGISTTGELDFSPEGVGLTITPMAKDASLDETVNCLWNKSVAADARYDLDGSIHLPPTREDPTRSITGRMIISSQNGKITRSSLLLEIFSILNITEMFVGGKSDLAGKGYGYTNATATATVGEGKIQLEEILLDGNSMKITGQGNIDLMKRTANILLLAAPLKTVDRIVKKIPVIGYITGGTLISVPLRVQGKLDDLSVVPIPPAEVGKSLLGIMERTLKAPFKLVKIAVDHSSKQPTGKDTPSDKQRYPGH
jgi:hypothetical protein